MSGVRTMPTVVMMPLALFRPSALGSALMNGTASAASKIARQAGVSAKPSKLTVERISSTNAITDTEGTTLVNSPTP